MPYLPLPQAACPGKRNARTACTASNAHHNSTHSHPKRRNPCRVRSEPEQLPQQGFQGTVHAVHTVRRGMKTSHARRTLHKHEKLVNKKESGAPMAPLPPHGDKQTENLYIWKRIRSPDVKRDIFQVYHRTQHAQQPPSLKHSYEDIPALQNLSVLQPVYIQLHCNTQFYE